MENETEESLQGLICLLVSQLTTLAIYYIQDSGKPVVEVCQA